AVMSFSVFPTLPTVRAFPATPERESEGIGNSVACGPQAKLLKEGGPCCRHRQAEPSEPRPSRARARDAGFGEDRGLNQAAGNRASRVGGARRLWQRPRAEVNSNGGKTVNAAFLVLTTAWLA